MKKLYKTLIVTLMMFSVLLINVPVFANDNATDVPGATPGGDGDYEDIYTGHGNFTTYDDVMKNPSMFSKLNVVKWDFPDIYNPEVSPHFKGMDKINFAMIAHTLVLGEDHKYFDSDCPICSTGVKYIYAVGYYYGTKNPVFSYIYTKNPLIVMNNRLYVDDYGSPNFLGSYGIGSSNGETNGGLFITEGSIDYNGRKLGVLGSFDISTVDSTFFPVLYPINGKIDTVVDGGGNQLAGTGDLKPKPDSVGNWEILSSFDKEKTKMLVTIKNVGQNRGVAMINLSEISAQINKNGAVRDNPLFNFRTWGKRTDGVYSYFYNLNFNSNEEKTYEVDLSNIDKTKIKNTDLSVYLNILGFHYTDDELYEKNSPIFQLLNGFNGWLTYGNVNNEIMHKMKPIRTTQFKFNSSLGYIPPKYENDLSDNGYEDNIYDKDGNKTEMPTITAEGFLKGIPKLFNNIVDGMKTLLFSIQGFFGLISAIFFFLPSEVWAIFIVGLSTIVILRLFGR